jgi:MarR family transcriptional regulator, organic hydroperoxide resistance regulator
MTENDALPPAGRSPGAAAEPAADFQTAFWSAKHALALASATAFSRHGVHEGQQFVLRSLWAEDGLTPGEVARRLGLATPTVTRATTRMEAAGLLRREPHPSDRRMVRLRLTNRGRSLEKVIDEEIRQLTDRALATLSTAEREALIRTLQQIRRNLGTVPG